MPEASSPREQHRRLPSKVKVDRALSVASLIVTYNSADMLSEQLTSLCLQTRVLDEVIVVDNASTDSTRHLLRERYPWVTVIGLEQNRGIGGALATGLRYAIEASGHDWIWMLDHDSIPRKDGLEQLLLAVEHVNDTGERIAVVAPLAVNTATELVYPGLLWRGRWVSPDAGTLREDISYVDVVISSGSLVCAEAVRVVGLPRADLFMDFVDFEHCLRFRRHGYKIAVVRNSILDHTMGSPRLVSFLGMKRTWADHAPWREYYMARNQIFTLGQYFPDWKSKIYALWKVLRHLSGILLFGRNKIECLRMICFGIHDGCKGRLGIRFPGASREEVGCASAERYLVDCSYDGDMSHSLARTKE